MIELTTKVLYGILITGGLIAVGLLSLLYWWSL